MNKDVLTKRNKMLKNQREELNVNVGLLMLVNMITGIIVTSIGAIGFIYEELMKIDNWWHDNILWFVVFGAIIFLLPLLTNIINEIYRTKRWE